MTQVGVRNKTSKQPQGLNSTHRNFSIHQD